MIAENVGILAFECYFPSYYVDQEDLENFSNISPGKFTVGLEQKKMSFCTAREDAVSMGLTVVHRMLKRLCLNSGDIGRIDVGSESNVDGSKSIRSRLSKLFGEDCDIEGADHINACYGGTAALFNILNWIESSSWDGRYGLLVTSDVAVYSTKSSAHATGGSGAIAYLIGPNAPIVFQPRFQVTLSRDVYDFYKPTSSQEYPYFDGKLSICCYLNAAMKCWLLFKRKMNRTGEKHVCWEKDYDFYLFHTPFSRLVKKAFCYISSFDKAISKSGHMCSFTDSQIFDFYHKLWESSTETREYEKNIIDLHNKRFEDCVMKSQIIPQVVGNTYTSSVYCSLISLIANESIENLINKKMIVFSYGSGLIASMYSIRINHETETCTRECDHSQCKIYSLSSIKSYVEQIQMQLERGRQKCNSQFYEETMKMREEFILHPEVLSDIDPESCGLLPETFYLKKVDEMLRRYYELFHPNDS